jgi:hypothetical protein
MTYLICNGNGKNCKCYERLNNISDRYLGSCLTFLNTKFVLQLYYRYRATETISGQEIVEPLGLRSLCKYFFKMDMQPDVLPHSPAVDASWTMSLFLDVYVNTTTSTERMERNLESSNEICSAKVYFG